ncbi:MAG TPA: tetratricopeptide repeat protein [Sedimentisphaerales bacterium]|nr:tetratricopeptide repeat protein [Sedimentisphaerales bacterium]HQI27029.1 tetratricopeptide repeat protein [Sedimentisphaerales bacterium]
MRKILLALTVLTLVGCATSTTSTVPPKDRELSRTGDLARAAFEDGATAKAIDLYRKALNRAHAMDDATEIGNTAYNLAMCHTLMGQLDQASAALAEARSAFERSGSAPADMRLLEATIAQRQGNLERALSLADQVLSASSDESHRFQAALLKGTIACELNDPVRARAALAEADQHHVANTPLWASRERLAGNIFLLEGNPAEAAAALDRAVALFQKAKHYRDMGLTLRRAGEAYREAGDTLRAEDRLFRANRSLAAQGEKAE